LRAILSKEEKEELGKYVIDLYKKFIPIKALAPEFGGEGEAERAEVLEEEVKNLGLKPTRLDAPDPRAKKGVRPNILAKLEGEDSSRTLWIVGHMDVVPEGDISLWKYPPYEVTVKDDYIYGRGVEDDGQAIVIALATAKYLLEKNIKPRINLGIALVSDEEVGSKYGLIYLLEKDAFSGDKENYFLVPDAGSPDGSKMIVAEKHILHLKVIVEGRQAHASTPHLGLNAHRLGMKFNLLLDDVLHERLSAYDDLYEPPVTTCEPTKKEKNIENVNTIPGTDVVYWDCRILPNYNISDVVNIIKTVAYNFSASTGSKVKVEVLSYDDAGEPTKPDHPFVRSFAEAIKETRNVDVKPIGIGGGTVARYLRKKGYPAIVWMTCDDTAHQPNEYTKLSYVLSDVETVLYYIMKKA
jgi:succinyl-diaminopimelate desuccinylase